MFSTSGPRAPRRAPRIASPAGRHVLFDVTQIYRTAPCEMDTRALKNPYHDYDGNPALTRELFDSHGRVRKDGGLGGDSCTRNSAPTCIPPPLCFFQLTPEFSQRLCCKIHELLSVMENGLKSADPRDCTSYTGWAGRGTHRCEAVQRTPVVPE